MGFCRRGADHELLGDLVVAQAGGDEGHDLALAGGQLVELLGAGQAWVGLRGELEHEATHDAGRERGLAGGHGPHTLDQARPLGVPEQESAGPGPQRGKDLLVVLQRAEDQHTHGGCGRVGDDPSGHLHAVEAGQRDVHDHDVGMKLGRQADGRLAVGRDPATARPGASANRA